MSRLFTITTEGIVASSVASGVDDTVASCVADVVKQIEFPKLVNGGIMKAGDKLIVERESQKGEAAQLPVGEPAPDQRRAAGEGA